MNRDDRQRVVITGMGVVSPNAIGVDAYAAACAAGESGLCAYEPDASLPLQTGAVGRVCDFDVNAILPPAEARRVPRMVHLALAASLEAMKSAGICIDEQDLEAQRGIGVALGTGGGGLAFVEDQYRALFTQGKSSLYSITAGTHGNLSSELSIALKLRGPSHVISTGCTSSTDAIGYAAMLIRAGAIGTMLAGGADAPIASGILQAFEKMRVISTRRWNPPSRASRPFSIDRDGFVLGEGAWMFILERRDRALVRGAHIVGEILGYASTCDAYHRVQIAPDVAEPVRAMEGALADAGEGVGDIDYINLHGTGTELNDRLETLAIHRCFGEQAHRIPASATKSMIGHPQGACGAAGLAATLLMMRDGVLHPTINLETPDPACDLDYVPNAARRATIKTALCNCIAFGSKNSALVVGV